MADNTEEKKIRFTAEGNGLLNFFKQAQSEFQKFQKEGKWCQLRWIKCA